MNFNHKTTLNYQNYPIADSDNPVRESIVKKVQASQSTLLEMFWPISAVTIDWVFFDHALTWSQILGAILMLTAIYRVTRRRGELED